MASGAPNRLLCPDPVRHLSVISQVTATIVYSSPTGQLGRQRNPAGSLLAEFGKKHGPPFLEVGELRPELFQLAVDPCQLGARLLFPQVPLTVQGLGEILDLAAKQPQPRVPVHRGGPVLQLARVDRGEDLILRQAVLLASRLVAQRRAPASPFSIVEVHVRPLSAGGGVR